MNVEERKIFGEVFLNILEVFMKVNYFILLSFSIWSGV